MRTRLFAVAVAVASVIGGCATSTPTCIEASCVTHFEASRITPETVEMYHRAGYRTPTFIPPTNYPPNLKKQGITGTLVVSLDIDAVGNVTRAEVVDAQPASIFDAAAIAYVRAFKFEEHEGPTFGQKQRVTYSLGR